MMSEKKELIICRTCGFKDCTGCNIYNRFNEWANAKYAIKEIKCSPKCAEMLPCGLCGITNKVCPSANTTYATGTQTTVTDIPVSYGENNDQR